MAKTVVLIDDDQDDLDVMKEAIEELDKTMICMSFIYPEEAVRVISTELILVPNYVFIDINMPRMTGDKCLQEIRMNPELDSVVITMFSTSMPSHMAQAFKSAGANYTFQKPNKIEAYQQILKSIFFPSPM